MGKRLYVGNLPYQCEEAQLRALFEQDGDQVEATAKFGPQGAKAGDPGIVDGAFIAECPE